MGKRGSSVVAAAVILGLTSVSSAGDQLYGVTWTGEVYGIDPQSGTTSFVLDLPTNQNALTAWEDGLLAGGPGNTLFSIDPIAGTWEEVVSLSGVPDTFNIRALAIDGDGELIATLGGPNATEPDWLASVDPETGVVDLIGLISDGHNHVQSLAYDADGSLFFGESPSGFGFGTVDPATADASTIALSNNDYQGMAFMSDGTLYAGRDWLFEIDPATGQSLFVADLEFDFRGFASIPSPGVLAVLSVTLHGPRRRRRAGPEIS